MDVVNWQVLFNLACASVGVLGTSVMQSVFRKLGDLEKADKDLADADTEIIAEVHKLALTLAQNFPTKDDLRDMRNQMREMKVSIDAQFERVFERFDAASNKSK